MKMKGGFLMKTVVVSLVILLSLSVSTQSVFARKAPPKAEQCVISSVFVDFTSSEVIINGNNFVQVVEEQELEPVVELANVGLVKDIYDNNQIVVQLPGDTEDGDYLLAVYNSKNTYCLYDLTIGAAGPQGEQGEIGPKGDKPAHNWSETKISFENPDGSWGNQVDLKGDKGDTGNPGVDGNDGAQGPQGYTGPQGRNCWDLNESGVCDIPDEDVNNDGSCTASDCTGPQGADGADGVDGAPGDSIVKGQQCTAGYVTGFDAEGNIICSGSTPAPCPCWTAETIDQYARVFVGSPIECLDGVNSDPQYINFYGEDDIHLWANIVAGDPYDVGAFDCYHQDSVYDVNILVENITNEEFNTCTEILLNSSMWALNCVE